MAERFEDKVVVITEGGAGIGRTSGHRFAADGADRMAAVADADLGGIDILVNNAGVHRHHAQLPYTRVVLPEWRRVMDVNVMGARAREAVLNPSERQGPGNTWRSVSSALGSPVNAGV